MTCLLSSYCTKADSCTAHIGVDIERCSAFKRKPLTNMEWIQSASMDELAEWLALADDSNRKYLAKNISYWKKWLQERHT